MQAACRRAFGTSNPQCVAVVGLGYVGARLAQGPGRGGCSTLSDIDPDKRKVAGELRPTGWSPTRRSSRPGTSSRHARSAARSTTATRTPCAAAWSAAPQTTSSPTKPWRNGSPLAGSCTRRTSSRTRAVSSTSTREPHHHDEPGVGAGAEDRAGHGRRLRARRRGRGHAARVRRALARRRLDAAMVAGARLRQVSGALPEVGRQTRLGALRGRRRAAATRAGSPGGRDPRRPLLLEHHPVFTKGRHRAGHLPMGETVPDAGHRGSCDRPGLARSPTTARAAGRVSGREAARRRRQRVREAARAGHDRHARRLRRQPRSSAASRASGPRATADRRRRGRAAAHAGSGRPRSPVARRARSDRSGST